MLFSHRNLYSFSVLFKFTISCIIAGDRGRGVSGAILSPVISLHSSITKAKIICMPSMCCIFTVLDFKRKEWRIFRLVERDIANMPLVIKQFCPDCFGRVFFP